MIKSLIGTVGRSSRRLLNRNQFSFYNEVPKFDPYKDYYSILEVNKQSSDSDIKRSYYRLAKAYHPDSNPGLEAKFKQINEAYSVLSDNKLKRQYDSARTMTGFSRRMSSKAGTGNFDYREYQAEYHNLSPQQQEQIMEQTRRKARKIIIFGLVMIVVLPFLTRRNHRYYVLDHGQLVPVEFEGGMRGGMMPPPNMYGPQGNIPYPNQQYGPQQGQQGYYGQQPQGYNSPYARQYSDYAQVARNVGRGQPNYQPGYVGPQNPQ